MRACLLNSLRVVDKLNIMALPNGWQLELTEGLCGVASLPHGIAFQEIL